MCSKPLQTFLLFQCLRFPLCNTQLFLLCKVKSQNKLIFFDIGLILPLLPISLTVVLRACFSGVDINLENFENNYFFSSQLNNSPTLDNLVAKVWSPCLVLKECSNNPFVKLGSSYQLNYYWLVSLFKQWIKALQAKLGW